jgi:hypothetical protein
MKLPRRTFLHLAAVAITAWSRIEDNAFYAALDAAMRESVPGDLADRLLARSAREALSFMLW